MSDVAVVGAGASGMLAAGVAAMRGHAVTLIEKNDKPGRKLMITGKGRCNLTNSCADTGEFLAHVPRNAKFLFSSITAFGPQKTMAFFEEQGLKLKTERGKRVFPQSDRASDVVDTLRRYVQQSGCAIKKGRVTDIRARGDKIESVLLENGERLKADKVILCTGGKSYPLTGSTGDGYALAKRLGHTITGLNPSLVPIVTQESWPTELQGLSLRNVTVSVWDDQKKSMIFHELGEMLFTHFGVSGPLILSASSHIREPEPGRYRIVVDLKPGLTEERLEARLQRDFIKFGGKIFRNSLGELLPAKLIPVAVRLSGIPPEAPCSQITKERRRSFALLLKHMTMTVGGFRSLEEAIVTSGGVKTSEINPRTMESRLVKGLFFAGEIIDCDAYTGGFNLQIAFSTGYAAGNAV